MGNAKSKKVVDTSYVEFSVRIGNLRIVNFNNYSTFDAGFQQRFSLNVWSEFRQTIETAVNSYTNDAQLTSWKGTYKCLSIIPVILIGISGISAIYSFYALLFGLLFGATGIWISAVILICLICVWGIIGFIIRTKLTTLKEAYHREIDERVQNAMNQLNNRYNSICQFQLERISGAKAVDFDSSINLRMFFRITLFVQHVNQQYGGMGNNGQPQQVMVQMPNGQYVMAQVVGQPVGQMGVAQPVVQQQYIPQQQQQQQQIVNIQRNGPQYMAPSLPQQPNAPPLYAPIPPNGTDELQEGGDVADNQRGGEGRGNEQHTMQ